MTNNKTVAKDRIIDLIKKGYYNKVEIAINANVTMNSLYWYWSKYRVEIEKAYVQSKKARLIRAITVKGIIDFNKLVKITGYSKAVLKSQLKQQDELKYFVDINEVLKSA